VSERPNCLNRDDCQAKTPGKHCRRCAMIAVRSVDHLNRWRATPEGKRVQRDRAMVRLAKMNSPEALAARKIKIRKQRLGWCPPHRIDEYLALARKLGAPDARRLILQDEGDRADGARNAIQRIADEQVARHQRQLAEAY